MSTLSVTYWPLVHGGRYGCYIGRSVGNTRAVWMLWRYRLKRWRQRKRPKYSKRVTWEVSLSVYASFIYAMTVIVLYAGVLGTSKIEELGMSSISVPMYGGLSYLEVCTTLLGEVLMALVVLGTGFVRGHAGGAYLGRMIDAILTFWYAKPGGILVYFEALEPHTLGWRIFQQAGRVSTLPNGAALYAHYNALHAQVMQYKEQPALQLEIITAYVNTVRGRVDQWSAKADTPEARGECNTLFFDFLDNIKKAALIEVEGVADSGQVSAAQREGAKLGDAFLKIDPYAEPTPSEEEETVQRSWYARFSAACARWLQAFYSLPLAGRVLLLLGPIGFVILFSLLYADQFPHFVTGMWGQFSQEDLKAFRDKHPVWFFLRAFWWSATSASQTANYLGKLFEYCFGELLGRKPPPFWERRVSVMFSVAYVVFPGVFFLPTLWGDPILKKLLIANNMTQINAHFYGVWHFLGNLEKEPEGDWVIAPQATFFIIVAVLMLHGHADGAYLGRVIDSLQRVYGSGEVVGENVVFFWQTRDGVMLLASAHAKQMRQAEAAQATEATRATPPATEAGGEREDEESERVGEKRGLLRSGEMVSYGAAEQLQQPVHSTHLTAMAQLYQQLADTWDDEDEENMNQFNTLFTFIQGARAQITLLSQHGQITTHEQHLLLECDVLDLLRELEIFLVELADHHLPEEYTIEANDESARLLQAFTDVCHAMLGVSAAEAAV